MRILWVVGKFPELTFILRTVSALAERGHQVTVATRQRGDWRKFQSELPLPKTLTVRYLLPDNGLSDPRRLLALLTGVVSAVVRNPRKVMKLWQQCRTQSYEVPIRRFFRYLPFLSMKADLIQFDFPMLAAGYRALGEMLHAPTVVSCRGADVHMLEQRNDREQEGRLWSLHNATALHCVSEEMAITVERVSGRTEQVWVNRPAIGVDRISSKAGYPKTDSPLIVCVGRLTWKKGFDYLLAALGRLNQRGLSFQAQIIGDGELKSVLRFSIEDLALKDRVTLVGALPAHQVLERMHTADLFVLSSHEEGISNAALEAMASGLPVVTTNAGGMAEAVRDGIDGYVVPVRDIAVMTDRIARLLTDPALREQMGRSARARVEAEFSLERQARVFEEMYNSVVKKA